MHYNESSQATKWQLTSQHELNSLRERANRRARDALSGEAAAATDDKKDNSDNNNGANNVAGDATASATASGTGTAVTNQENASPNNTANNVRQVFGFAATRGDRPKVLENNNDTPTNDSSTPTPPLQGPTHTPPPNSHPLLTPFDESLLLSFYTSKIPLLIGPHATHPKCRRDQKVSATASLLFRRFYLSNSVMMHDPKTILVSAAFLAAKVEDVMLDVRYLEMGTKEMNAHVSVKDILEGEIVLLKGVDFDLLVFHPYKTVLSYTEDLRTYLKSERGRGLVSLGNKKEDVVVVVGNNNDQDSSEKEQQQEEQVVVVAGEDLRPMHDEARKIVDDVIVSDVPLLYGPGEVGLAALMVANEELCKTNNNAAAAATEDEEGESTTTSRTMTKSHNTLNIDMMGYIRSRFQDVNEPEFKVDTAAIEAVLQRVTKLCQILRELKEGKHGCGNHNVDMEQLKGVHKKLKKCRAWGGGNSGQKKDKEGKKKKKKKRKAEEVVNAGEGESAAVGGEEIAA